MSSGQLVFPFLVLVCPSLWQCLQVCFLFVVVDQSSLPVKTHIYHIEAGMSVQLFWGEE